MFPEIYIKCDDNHYHLLQLTTQPTTIFQIHPQDVSKIVNLVEQQYKVIFTHQEEQNGHFAWEVTILFEHHFHDIYIKRINDPLPPNAFPERPIHFPEYDLERLMRRIQSITYH